MLNDTKDDLARESNQNMLPFNEYRQNIFQKSNNQKDLEEGDKENISVNLAKEKEVEVNPEKFNGPVQKPKTANKAFGSMSDFLLFFERRNSEMKELAKKFKEIEDLDPELSIKMLNTEIIPILDTSLNEIHQKIRTKTKSILKRKNKYDKLFSGPFNTWGDFYKQVFRVYTINGFLFKKLNKYLRNENWMKLDALLPYTYCLLKAFLWGSSGPTMQESFEALKEKLQENNKLILYRRADFDDHSLNFYDENKVKNFSWNGVTSTSLEKSVTEKFQGSISKRPILIIIEIDFEGLRARDLNALYLAEFSEYPQEQEVALPPGSIFELLGINKEENEVVMRLRLVTNAKVLAHKGQFMHGMLQAIMRKENVLKIACLYEKELSRAIKHCQGNRLITDLEFCFCTFNEKSVEVLKEVLPTIENLASLSMNIVMVEESCRLSGLLECFGNKRMKKLQIIGSLSAKKHVEEMIEGMKYLRSLEYLKFSFEEDCQMDVNLLQGFFRRSSEFLNSECILDIDIGTRYNIVTKKLNLDEFEKFAIEALRRSWPTGWGSSLKYVTGGEKKLPKDVEKQVIWNDDADFSTLETADTNKEKALETVDIIESATGVRRYCFEDIEGRTLLEALESRFLLGPERIDNVKELKFLTSLHLGFHRSGIKDEEWSLLCSQGIQSLKFLKTFDLDLSGLDISDEGVWILSCEGIKYLGSLTSLRLNFSDCHGITNQGFYYVFSEGLQYLEDLTSLDINLQGCDLTSDLGLKWVFFEDTSNLQKLTSLRLNFSNCRGITDQKFRRMFSEGIRHLKKLTYLHLNFSNCQEITDQEFGRIFSEGIRHLQELKSLHLNFSSCSQITNQGFERMFFEAIRYLKELTSLDLNFQQCGGISDQGFELVDLEKRHYRQKLISLNLNFNGCNRITNLGFERLFSKKIQHLQSLTCLSLSFEGCDRISNQALENLSLRRINCLQNLTTLHLNLQKCPKITEKGLKSMCLGWVKGMQFLTLFNLISDCLNEQVRSKILSTLKQRNTSFSLSESREIVDERMNLDENTVSVKYEVKHGFYFQRNSLQAETSIPKLVANYSPFDSRTETEKASTKYCVKLHLNFNDGSIDHCSNHQENDRAGWENVEALSFVFNDHCLPTIGSLNKFYKNTIQCFPSVTRLYLSSNIARFPLEEGLQSLVREGFQSLKSLKSMSFKFPKTIVAEKIQKEVFKTPSVSLTLLTRRKSSRKTPFQITKQNQELSVFNIEGQRAELEASSQEDLLRFKSVVNKQRINQRYLNQPSTSSSQSEFQPFFIDEGEIRERNLAASQEKINLNFSENNNTFLSEMKFKELKCFQSLQALSLSFFGRAEATNKTLEDLAQGLSRLKFLKILNLNFYGCQCLSDNGLFRLSKKGLQQLDKLTELSLNFGLCSHITDQGIEYLSFKGLKNLKQLTKLDLGFMLCTCVTDIGLEILAEKMGENLRFLANLRLNLNFCSLITDFGLEWLSERGIQHLKSLTTLSLSFDGCPKISDRGIQILSFKGIRYLKSLATLGVSFDGNRSSILTNEGLNHLCCEGISHLKSLVSLYINFYMSEGISSHGLESLLCQGIHHLDKLTTLELVSQSEHHITDLGIKAIIFKGISKLISLENLQLPLMRPLTSSPSISEAFINILAYFGLSEMFNKKSEGQQLQIENTI